MILTFLSSLSFASFLSLLSFGVENQGNRDSVIAIMRKLQGALKDREENAIFRS